VYVYWRQQSTLWGRVWANISHCVYLGDSIGIMLYSGGPNGSASLKKIPCLNATTARNVYSALALNVARMGNPSNVIPVDVVFQAHNGKGKGNSGSGSGGGSGSNGGSGSGGSGGSGNGGGGNNGNSGSGGSNSNSNSNSGGTGPQHMLLQDGRKTAHSTKDALRLALDESLLGALDGYRFGSANGRKLRSITGSEEDVLQVCNMYHNNRHNYTD
jgi:hypothetical protein